MPGDSTIEWTDASWNPSTGCTRVSAGCDHCYAFALHDQRHAAYLAGTFPDAPAQYHKPFSEVQLMPERLDVPLRWTKPRKIFVDSMADLFHPDVPDEFVDRVFGVMAGARRHTFQVLTKRPQRMKRYLSDPMTKYRIWHAGRAVAARSTAAQVRQRDWYDVVPVAGPGMGEVGCYPAEWPLPNVWIGTSVENEEVAWRIKWLAETPAAVRFLSCEPLLGPIDLGFTPRYPAEFAGRKTWEAFPWPDWIPASIRAEVERFWESRCGGPAAWIQNGQYPYNHAPAFGETATLRTLAPGPETATGRYVHAWNNIGRLVIEDGSVECVSNGVTRPRTPIDWVIAGGESGPEFRAVDPDWIRGLRDQSTAAGVAFFFKQWGGRTSKAGGRELDGRTWDEFPGAA